MSGVVGDGECFLMTLMRLMAEAQRRRAEKGVYADGFVNLRGSDS